MRWLLATLLPFALYASEIPSIRPAESHLQPQNVLDIEWIFWTSFAVKAGPEEAVVYLPSTPSIVAKDDTLLLIAKHEEATYTFGFPCIYTPHVPAETYFQEALTLYDTYPLHVLHSSFSVKEGQEILDLSIENQAQGTRMELRMVVTPYHHYTLATTHAPKQLHKHQKFVDYFMVKEILE